MECWVEGPNNTFLLTLHGVLHVPSIKCRFLSLSTFDDKGFLFTAKNRQFELKKGQAGITGCCVGKLYIAPMWQHKPPHSSAVHLNAAMVALPAKVWHEQMGHLDWDSEGCKHGRAPCLQRTKTNAGTPCSLLHLSWLSGWKVETPKLQGIHHSLRTLHSPP